MPSRTYLCHSGLGAGGFAVAFGSGGSSGDIAHGFAGLLLGELINRDNAPIRWGVKRHFAGTNAGGASHHCHRAWQGRRRNNESPCPRPSLLKKNSVLYLEASALEKGFVGWGVSLHAERLLCDRSTSG